MRTIALFFSALMALPASAALDTAREAALEEVIPTAVGPYMRYITPTSAELYWETAGPTPTRVEVVKEDNEGVTFSKPEPATVHRVELTDLDPDTVYVYRLDVADASGKEGTNVYTFDTTFNYVVPPVAGDAVMPGVDDVNHGALAEAILNETGTYKGYCLVYGATTGALTLELAKRSELMFICLAEDRAAVQAMRQGFSALGLYGNRVTVRPVESLAKTPITSYFANLLVSEVLAEGDALPGNIDELERLLRPNGGQAVLTYAGDEPEMLAASGAIQWIEKAETLGVEQTTLATSKTLVYTRPKLPGAGQWTHQYGDAGNTSNSGDTLYDVGATKDTMVQWLGRPGADFGIDRNPRMPAPLSGNGRLFHQGLNRMIGVDAYNGATLWLLEIPGLRRVNIPRDASNWCIDDDDVYTAVRDRCWRIDAQTGAVEATLPLPDMGEPPYDWGYVGRVDELLYGSHVRQGGSYLEYWGKAAWYDATMGEGTHKVCSDAFFAADPVTGEERWRYAHGKIINTTISIGDGHVYFIESRHPGLRKAKTGRIEADEIWLDQYLVKLDAKTGEVLYQNPIDTPDGIVVFFLVYDRGNLFLAASGANEYHIDTFNAANGSPRWDVTHAWPSDNHGGHMQHPAVSGDYIFLEPWGYNIATGERTAEEIGAREGCATYAATSNALIYRGASRRVSMWDMTTKKVSTWQSLRPSCWLSVVPAQGMVMAPEGGGGCSCGNWLETSLAFVPQQQFRPTNESGLSRMMEKLGN